MTPIVIGLIFVLTMIPVGYLRRLKHPDSLKQRFDSDAPTYWVSGQRVLVSAVLV